MPWGRFDDQYPANRKVRKLSHEAFRLDVSGILWCCRYATDGFISDDDLPLVCAEVRNPKRAADELVNRNRWERLPGGYYIHDYLEYNPTAEQVQAEREAKNARQQRWRNNTRNASRGSDVDASTDATHDASRDGVTDASKDAAPRARVPDPTRPHPLNNTSSSADADDGPTPPPKRNRNTRTPPERFDEFWRAYPRRVGKINAEKAYAKALAAGATPDLLISGAQFYAMEKKLTDPQYIKHPASWLNGGCWQDEPDPAYTPPAISAPSEAVRHPGYRPYAEVVAEQARYTGPIGATPLFPQVGMSLDD